MAIKKEQLRYAADMDAALLYAGLTGKNGEGARNYALNAARNAVIEGKVLEQLAKQASESGDLLGAATLSSTDPNSLDTNTFSAMLQKGHRNYVQRLDVPSYLAHLKSALGYTVPKNVAEEVAKEFGETITIGKIYSQLEQAEEDSQYEELTAKRENRKPVVDEKKLARLQRRREIVDLLMGQALKARGGALDDLVARDTLSNLLKEVKQA